jgi:hypothetical protein
MGYLSTKQVAERLGIKPDRLQKMIWTGRVTGPEKSPGGDYLWDDQSIERASWQLRRYGIVQGENNDNG